MERLFASKLRKALPPLLGGALAVVAIPSAGVALAEATAPSLLQTRLPLTPANVDPELAMRVAERFAARPNTMPFTPAAGVQLQERTVTVAVRVDDKDAKAIATRGAIDVVRGSEPGRRDLGIAPTAFDLGVARGYQSFTRPATELPRSVSRLAMPDLSEYRPTEGTREDRPSRFQTRVTLEEERTPGRAPRTLQGQGDRGIDLGGAYRVTGNLNLTAGVRISEERDPLAPLTNGTEDSQSVYVGTQLRF